MNKFYGIGIALALLLSGGSMLVKTAPVVSEQSVREAIKEEVGKLGSVQSYLPTPEINLGGLRLVGTEKALATATSTVCAIQSPAATSTLISAGIKFTLASTSAVNVDLAKNTTAFGTTTLLATSSVAASAQATIIAATTTPLTGQTFGTAMVNDRTFAPSNWFVVKHSDTGTGAGNAATGRCWAVFATPQ